MDIRVGKKSADLGVPRGLSLVPIGKFECIEKEGSTPLGKIRSARCSRIWTVSVNCSKATLKQATQVKGETLGPVRVPACPYHDQSVALADQYWRCGRQLRSTLPADWSGRCARVQAVQEVVIFPPEGGGQNISAVGRVKRSCVSDSEFTWML